MSRPATFGYYFNANSCSPRRLPEGISQWRIKIDSTEFENSTTISDESAFVHCMDVICQALNVGACVRLVELWILTLQNADVEFPIEVYCSEEFFLE